MPARRATGSSFSKAYTNLGLISFRRKHYAEALQQHETALAGLTGSKVSLSSAIPIWPA